MEWLLLIVLLVVDDGEKYGPVLYPFERECIAAAQEFVGRHPAFEWRDHRRPNGLMAMVLRPHVECQRNAMSAH